MPSLKFAVAIISPEIEVAAIAHAAIKNRVHIIDKECFDFEKDYTDYKASLTEMKDGQDIALLFVFADGSSCLVDDIDHVQDAVARFDLRNN